MDKLVVHELIQNELNTTNLEKELRDILENEKRIEEMKKDFISLREKLGAGGASQRTAKIIYDFLYLQKTSK